jgi:tRNA-uridine 2-sulfurtransferase
MNRPRVIVGLSGGVDSSVSAWLLLQKKYEVQGLFMKNWEQENQIGPCTAAKDWADAQAVCDRLGIPLHTANFAEAYWEEVFSHFLNEYRANRTPNPDILCNKVIKFKYFLDYAQQLGADYIATGHYASNQVNGKQHALCLSKDNNKDQTYFLYTLGQPQLEKTLFPLAHMRKPQVRQLAALLGLSTHNKKDSVGICFIGKQPFKKFLQRYLPAKPGLIQTPDNKTVGEHEGLMYYTLGQRQGLKIGGKQGFPDKPWYVIAKETETNILRVVQGNDHASLYAQDLSCTDLHWVAGYPPILPLACTAKIRYRQAAASCTLTSITASCYHVHFEMPQWAITPGQSIVFYQDNRCLGGGIII